MKKKLLTVIGSVCLALVLAGLLIPGCAKEAPVTPAPAPTVPAEVIELKWSTFYPILHPMNYDCYSIWAKELDRRTGGRTRTTIYGGGSLATPRQNWDAVRTGMADIGEVWVNNFPGLFPVSEILLLPFWAPQATVSGPSLHELFTTHPEMQNEWEEVHVLAFHTSDIINLHTTKKLVKTLEDLKGMRLGGDSASAVEWFRKFGAAAEKMDTHDAYLAMDKGVVEGGMWPWAPLRSKKLDEFINYHTIIDLCFVGPAICMNKDTWESLPEDIQGIVDDMSGLDLSAFAGYTLTYGAEADRQYMADKGDEFYTLLPDEKARWAEAIAYIVDDWKDNVKEKGLVADPDKMWNDLLELSAKYQANPYPESEWWGPEGVGRFGSPNRPGGWK